MRASMAAFAVCKVIGVTGSTKGGTIRHAFSGLHTPVHWVSQPRLATLHITCQQTPINVYLAYGLAYEGHVST